MLIGAFAYPKQEVEIYTVDTRPETKNQISERGDTGLPIGYGLGVGLGAIKGLSQVIVDDAKGPSVNRRSGGYGGYSSHEGTGSLLGAGLGNILGSILKGLSGVGVKVGLKLNNEFYRVKDDGYGGGGYGGGGYGGGGHGGGGYGGGGHGGGGYGGGGHGGGGY